MRYRMVLKAIVTRPWVWLMAGMSVLQGFMLVMTILRPGLDHAVDCFPKGTMPESTIESISEFNGVLEARALATVTGLNTTNIPDTVLTQGQRISESAPLTILSQMPKLKGLILRPGTQLTMNEVQILSHFTQLESLTLTSNSVSVAKDAEWLRQISQLRELYALGISEPARSELPEMPQLEVLAVDDITFHGDWVSQLKTSCPKLRTLILRPSPAFSMSPQQIASLNSHPALSTVFLVGANSESVEHLLESMRTQLPDVSVQRGSCWSRRIHVAGYMALICMFLPMAVWVQSAMMLSLPQAMVMPGHRSPHLFWPMTAVILMVASYVALTTSYGVHPLSAVLLGILATTTAANGIGNCDLTDLRRSITGWFAKLDLFLILGLAGMFTMAHPTMDRLLLGDYSSLVAVCVVLCVLSFLWKLNRLVSLSRIVAENGMTGIPGLDMSGSKALEQNMKVINPGLLARLQMSRRERGIDRQIAIMNRQDRVAMLRAALPGAGAQWLFTGLLIILIATASFVGFRLLNLRIQLDRRQLITALIPLISWAMIFLISLTGIQWILRRNTITTEFLLPHSRADFWKSMRIAIFHDLKFHFGLLWIGTCAGPCIAASQFPGFLSITLSLAATLGAFAWVHGWLFLCIIGRRLWLHSSVGCATGMFAIVLAAVSAGTSIGTEQNRLLAWIAAGSVVTAGAILQWVIQRRLETWELA